MEKTSRAGQLYRLRADLYSTPLLLEVPLEEKFTFSTSVDTKCAHEAYEVSILGAAPSLVGVRLSNSAQGSP